MVERAAGAACHAAARPMPLSNIAGIGDPVNDAALLPLILAILATYFVPSILALLRAVPNRGSVVVVNLFLGWTLLGWVASLAMACRSHGAPAAIHRS